MESINKKIIFITLILAAMTTVLVYVFIKNQTKIEESNVEKKSIYVAVNEIPARHKITEIDVVKKEIESEYINPSAIVDLEQIIGKRTKEVILKGEQILNERLVEDEELTLSYEIEKNKRAVSINIDEQKGVAFQIKKGDYIDVIATFKKTETDNADKVDDIEKDKISKSKTILQKVKVLMVGKSNEKVDAKTEAATPATVTLELSPEDVEKLVAASEFSSIRLALRHIDDQDTIDSKGIRPQELIK